MAGTCLLLLLFSIGAARGDVYTYGKNDSGTLGHGHQVAVKKPLAIAVLKYAH